MDVDESRTKTTSAALWQGANKRKARVINQKWFLNIVTQPAIYFDSKEGLARIGSHSFQLLH